MNSRIVLGTAQLGLDYGINNKTGKIPLNEAFDLLMYANSAEIDTLDTASVYGDSEEVIGEFVGKYKKWFNIVTKFSGSQNEDIRNTIELSLKKLKVESLYGCLVHNFNDFKRHAGIFTVLRTLKSQGKIKKIGFSLYHPSEIEYLLEHGIDFDVVQVPYSVFDRRFEEKFSGLKQLNVEIQVRSVFLQGLIFKPPESIDPYFKNIKGVLSKLWSLADRTKCSLAAIGLNFALLNKNIDRVVVGVDSLINLQEIIESSKNNAPVVDIYRELRQLSIEDEAILLPYNWRFKEGIAK